MKVQVKVCGLRTEADVSACVEAGVDMAGFNFWEKSKRYISPHEAARLVALLPGSVLPVGVFVRATPEKVRAACVASRVRMAQLHGDEDPGAFSLVPVPLLQVVRVPSGATLASLPSPVTPMVLVDAHVDGFGGGGQRFDWALARAAKETWGRAIFLAGGLTPENVRAAVLAVQPHGVDVASGVEREPGVKDPEKVRRFVAEVRAAEEDALHG
jgi:phosphoribosylanthranilate isomerase